MPSTNQPTWLPCVAFITKTFSIRTQHLYDYISTRQYEQLTTNLNIQHDLLVELENFYDHVDQNSVKRAIGMFTINMSKTTYVVYFISNQYFPQC